MSNQAESSIDTSESVVCSACNSRDLIRWGQLPVNTQDFLGSALDSTIDPGSLFECASCTLKFRAPQPSEEQLLSYYQHMDVTQCWQHGPEREVWRYVKQELEHIPKPSVLDVGCFRGEMLAYLGERWERFGVEPSREAALQAQRRGIDVIAESIESLGDTGLKFGAITLIDVAEHLPRPIDSLKLLIRLLLPGGKLIIFTGNTAALSWRLSGLDYYYSAMPEHVAFMRPSWFRWAASRLNCEVVSIKRLRYQAVSLRKQVDEGLKNLLYIGYHRLEGLPLMSEILSKLPLVKRVGRWHGCWWTSARDHVLVIMKLASDQP
jgi:SAM-dependent methyltransferase